MYPFLFPELLGTYVPMYDLLILIGVFIMMIYVIHRLDHRVGFTKLQTYRIVILIVISLVSALGFSLLLDGIFHSIKEGKLTFGSVSFLSALIGGFITFLILVKYFIKEEKKDLKKIADTLIMGVILAHAVGRIGCFCAGCCFGIPTESYLGVLFPHGQAHALYPGEHVYPTQLFEAGFLFILFMVLNGISYFKGKELEFYMIGYGIWRFMIEFVRGDNRGILIRLFETNYNVFPTPSQFMSLILIILGLFMVYRNINKTKKV